MRIRLAMLLALAVVPGVARPQGGDPVGSEFRVNSYTTSDQGRPAIATDGAGNFVVAWESSTQDGSGYGIFGQRYASSGVPLGPEFRVNTFTTSNQRDPSLASDAAGNFVIVWHSVGQYGYYHVFGQRYSSAGVPLGTEFRVNTYSGPQQARPSVAIDPTGAFVVVWDSMVQDGAATGIFGQRYSSSGVPLGPEFRINSYTTGDQLGPSVATDSSGNFVVAWESIGQDGGGSYTPGVFAQRYASSGVALGLEFLVNSYFIGFQGAPAVASDAGGNFLVVWNGVGAAGSGFDIFGQRYANSGGPLGTEFRINTYTTQVQAQPSTAIDGAGNFVVTWQSYSQDGSSDGVFGQRYSTSGSPLGSDFRVNTYTTLAQGAPSVAVDPTGDFVVVWDGDQQDGSGGGVFGQRFGRIVSVELVGYGVE